MLATLAFNGLFLGSLHTAVHDFALGLLARYRQRKLIGILHTFYGAYADFSCHPKTLFGNFLLTVLEHGLQLLVVFAIATSLGVHAEPVVLFAAAAVQTLLLRLPIAPDGWGTGELAAIAVFGLIGINAAEPLPSACSITFSAWSPACRALYFGRCRPSCSARLPLRVSSGSDQRAIRSR